MYRDKYNPTKKSTWVYLIKDNFTGYYKIGRSINPQERLRKLIKQDTKLPLPNDFVLVEAWKSEVSDETFLHRMFDENRIRGEWFALTDKQLQKIKDFFKTIPRFTTNTSLYQELSDILSSITITDDQFTPYGRANFLDAAVEGFGLEIS